MFVSKADTLNEDRRFPTAIVGESRTKQSFRDQCDINRIMKSYRRTGLVSHLRPDGGRYEDLPDAIDYHQAVTIVTHAQQAFDAMPAKIRDRFKNAPGELLAFLGDPENRDEAVKLGLVEAVEAEGGDLPEPVEGGGPPA